MVNCTAAGFPLPSVVWFKDNKEYPGQMVGPYMQMKYTVHAKKVELWYYFTAS